MTLKLDHRGPTRGAYAKGLSELQQPIARALTESFRTGAKMIQDPGRAQMASAGLTRRFQTGFRVAVTPRQFSMRPVIRGTHRIGFINIFERGGTIAGNPYLWLPLPTAPKRIGGKRTTAAAYVREIGKLVSINRPGKPPLLAGQALRRPGGAVSLAALRTGARRAAAGRRTVLVPLFVGVRRAHIRKRLNISPLYERVRLQLGELYLRAFERST